MEENYELLEEKKIDNLMKFPLYHKEQTRKYKNNPFNKDNFTYDAGTDTYGCPNGKKLSYKSDKKDRNKTAISPPVGCINAKIARDAHLQPSAKSQ